MRTIPYNDVERRFQSIAGLQSLTVTDKFFFQNSLNSRLKEAWDRAEWPELLIIEEHDLTSDDDGSQVTGTLDFDVLEVYDRHPNKDRDALILKYNLINAKVAVRPHMSVSKIYILRKINFGVFDPADNTYKDYTEGSDVPAIFENYLITAIFADFLRGDGQGQLAMLEDNRAENFLLNQIDRVERLQQQNRPVINSYPRHSTQSITQVNI